VTALSKDFVAALAAAARVKIDPTPLHLHEVIEQGKRFETGVPVTFRFVRNTERSPKITGADPYAQKIEPHGRFMLHQEDPGTLPSRWETGIISFKCPLVLRLSLDPDKIYGETGWKARLVAATKKKGKPLTCLLRKLGFDGVVTVSEDDTREIVDLRVVPC